VQAVLLVSLEPGLPTMSLQIIKPVTRVEIEENEQRVLPVCTWEEEILLDTTKNQWKLGKLIGSGGSGEVYLASNNIYEPVDSDAQHIVKVEQDENGSLIVEINFYTRMGESAMVDEWKSGRMLKHLGLSQYLGSGSHIYRGKKYLFIVLERHGQDLDALFVQSGRFSVKTVCYLGIQILDILEYIHSHGYVHADIKARNLQLGNSKGTENCVYLTNFGLAHHYLYQNGVHNTYVYDQSKVHTGALKYLSRDAHVGAFSRRGDLETLGYNMLQWLCGMLPWEEKGDPQYNYYQKKSFMFNIHLLIRQCFLNAEPPAILIQYFEYVDSLDFESEPNYTYCRNLLKQGVEDSGCVDDGKLVFGVSTLERTTENSNRGNKRRATENPESAAELQTNEGIHNTPQQHCVRNRMIRDSPSAVLQSYKVFNGEKIIPGNPENQIKENADLNHKLPTIIPVKYKPVVLLQRLPNEVIQKFTASFPEMSKPTKHMQGKTDRSSSSSSSSTPPPPPSSSSPTPPPSSSSPPSPPPSSSSPSPPPSSLPPPPPSPSSSSSSSIYTPSVLTIRSKMRQKSLTPATRQRTINWVRKRVKAQREAAVIMAGTVCIKRRRRKCF
jgi:vaccinia related kinase